MAAAERLQTLETAARLGLPELAESGDVKATRIAYLKTYSAIRSSHVQPEKC